MKHTVRSKNAVWDGKAYHPTVELDNYTRALAIKLMCTECLGWGAEHPKDCTSPVCPLFPYRDITMAAYPNRPHPKGRTKAELDAIRPHR